MGSFFNGGAQLLTKRLNNELLDLFTQICFLNVLLFSLLYIVIVTYWLYRKYDSRDEVFMKSLCYLFHSTITVTIQFF